VPTPVQAAHNVRRRAFARPAANGLRRQLEKSFHYTLCRELDISGVSGANDALESLA
jgi:hypothetical protein